MWYIMTGASLEPKMEWRLGSHWGLRDTRLGRKMEIKRQTLKGRKDSQKNWRLACYFANF